jgi:hypothetical protein
MSVFPMTEFSSSVFQSIGLLSDIFGAWLLYRFGLPKLNRTGGAQYLELHSLDDAQKLNELHYDKMGKFGAVLLMIGFALQLAPNIRGLVAQCSGTFK